MRGFPFADAPLAIPVPRARTLSVPSSCSSGVPSLTTNVPTVFVSMVSLLCSLFLPRPSLAVAAAGRQLWDHDAGRN
jgi:hypothetical protein